MDINSLYYIGSILAVCMSNPTYDVLVGNVPGALKFEDVSKQSEEVASAVVNRGDVLRARQTRQQKLSVPILARGTWTPQV